MTMNVKDKCSEEIESWSSYEYALQKEDSEYFHNMLNEYYKYSKSINEKDRLLPTELMMMEHYSSINIR